MMLFNAWRFMACLAFPWVAASWILRLRSWRGRCGFVRLVGAPAVFEREHDVGVILARVEAGIVIAGHVAPQGRDHVVVGVALVVVAVGEQPLHLVAVLDARVVRPGEVDGATFGGCCREPGGRGR